MLIRPEVFPISKICDCDTSRYALGGVRLERDAEGPVAVATDGRRLIAVRWTEAPGEDYPAGVGDTTHVDNFETIIPFKQWNEAAKLPPKRTPKPILTNVLLEETSANGTVRMAATDLETTKQVTPRSLAGRFPRWRDVMPKDGEHDDENSVTVCLDATYLADVAAVLTKVATSDECRGLTLTVSRGDKPVVIRAKADGVSATAVIMPLARDK